VKPAPFQYHAARTIEEAVDLLGRFGDDARPMAGGQSLNPMLNFRVLRPAHVVDISRIERLRAIDATADRLWIGAAVTHARLEDSALPGVAGALIRHAAGGIAYRSVRNRGTIGGSVAHADAAADWPQVLCALDAVVQLVSASGRRNVPMRDFVHGVFETALAPGELIEGFEIAALPPDARWGLSKQIFNHGGFAAAIAVCVLTAQRRALWLGVCGTRPMDASAALSDLPVTWSSAARDRVKQAAIAEIERSGEPGSTDRYRRNLHAVNAAQSVEQAIDVERAVRS